MLETTTIGGYAHNAYAESLSEFAEPRLLPLSEAWILERPIPGSNYRDAMGCYPLFACRDWSQLKDDLDHLKGDLIALSVVTDPFGDYDYAYLKDCFGDRVTRFKEHFIADLHKSIDEIVSKHHRYYAEKALGKIEVEKVAEPIKHVDEWVSLYDNLIARHGLKGIKAFSKTAFAAQTQVPGLVMFRALYGGETVGMHLWYLQGDVAQSHLAAVSKRGYELMASYALHWAAIEGFAGRLRWLNFGAGAGLDAATNDGLTQFKRGWATETRTAYFCGRIFDQTRYEEISNSKHVSDQQYFPAYRQGEFE